MEVSTTPDPVGTNVKVQGLEDLVEKMKNAWDKIRSMTKTNWTLAFQFLVKCLDDMIVYLVEHNIPGEDKKATVMIYIGKLYDWVAKNTLPIFLKPFSGLIRRFVLNVIFSNAIDWIVSKYNSGSWHPQAVSLMYQRWGI